MSDWKLIKTAPKDGTVIDLWSRLYISRWSDCAWVEGKWRRYNNSYEPEDFDPTHWRPLPAVPDGI